MSARRHQADVVFRGVPAERTRVEYTDSGRISAVALMKILEPQLGVIARLRFRPSLKIDPNGVEWEGLDENANVVAGRLILHAAVARNRDCELGRGCH